MDNFDKNLDKKLDEFLEDENLMASKKSSIKQPRKMAQLSKDLSNLPTMIFVPYYSSIDISK